MDLLPEIVDCLEYATVTIFSSQRFTFMFQKNVRICSQTDLSMACVLLRRMQVQMARAPILDELAPCSEGSGEELECKSSNVADHLAMDRTEGTTPPVGYFNTTIVYMCCL